MSLCLPHVHNHLQFRMQLSRALAEAANSFDIVGSDGRIGPLLTVSCAVRFVCVVCKTVVLLNVCWQRKQYTLRT